MNECCLAFFTYIVQDLLAPKVVPSISKVHLPTLINRVPQKHPQKLALV